MYVINLDDRQSKRTHWVSFFSDKKMAVYFDFCEIEYSPQEVIRKIKEISIRCNILRINLMILLCVDFIVSLSENLWSAEKTF